MFYDKRGLTPHRQMPGYKEPIIQWDMKRGRSPILRIPPIFIKHERYDLLIGRGAHKGMIGLLYKVDGEYLIKMRPRKCEAVIEAYRHGKDFTREAIYHLSEDILYVNLPDGAREREDWWNRLPDVSDNPTDAIRKIRDMHGVSSGS